MNKKFSTYQEQMFQQMQMMNMMTMQLTFMNQMQMRPSVNDNYQMLYPMMMMSAMNNMSMTNNVGMMAMMGMVNNMGQQNQPNLHIGGNMYAGDYNAQNYAGQPNMQSYMNMPGQVIPFGFNMDQQNNIQSEDRNTETKKKSEVSQEELDALGVS